MKILMIKVLFSGNERNDFTICLEHKKYIYFDRLKITDLLS
jgi:hypothetical protein